MSPSVRKNLVSTLIVIAGFFLVAVLFNFPAIQGKILASSDYLNWKSISEEGRAWHEKTGEQVLWSNSMFGGMPSYTFYGPNGNNYVSYINDALLGILPRPANFMFLAMLCFFALASVMRVNKWLGAVGAIAYAFATYNCVITATGHETKMIDIAYMPAVVAGLILLMRGRYIGGAALFGISFSLALGAGHYQIVYYLLLTLVFIGLGLLIAAYRAGKVKSALIGGVVAIALTGIAAGANLGSILPTLEYSKQTQRGGASQLHTHDQGKKSGGLDKSYAFGWSNGIGESFCVLIPYLYGGSSREDATRLPRTYEATGERYPELPAYWGPQPILMGPVYFGAIICFLFVLGIMLIRNSAKWWLLGAAVFGFLLSVGDHFSAFNYFLFDYLPGLNKFRAPSTALVIPQLIFPIVAIWGLNDVLRGKVDRAELWKSAKIAAIAVGGLTLVLGLLGGLFFDFTNKATDAQFGELLSGLKEDRQALARNSALLSAFYIAATTGLIWLFVKDRIKAQWFIAGLGLLIAVDMMPVGYNYLRDMPGNPSSPYKDKDDYDAFFAPTAADQQVYAMAGSDPYYRVLDITRGVFSDALASFHHKSIGGYSAAKLENYQDLLDVHMSKGFNSEVLNMLNTRFIIVPGNGGQGPGSVIPNPKALGNAWFVSGIKWTKSAEEEISALNAPSLGDTLQVPNAFNPKEIGVLRDTYQSQLAGFSPAKDATAAIKLTKYGLNNLAFQSNNTSEGLGIFSDVYYDKGWKAYIDGKESSILRADYALRALRIPAGNHKIEFRFLPASYATGKMVALICSVILFALLAWALFGAWKNMQSGDDDGKKVLA